MIRRLRTALRRTHPRPICSAIAIAAAAIVALPLLIESGKLAQAAKRSSEPQPKEVSGWLGRPAGALTTEPVSALAPLVGMDVWVEMHSTLESAPFIEAVAPIYAGADHPQTGPFGRAESQPVRITAQPGYAVAGLVGRASSRILGFRLIFMRLHNGAFDPKDRYESRWIGGRGDDLPDVHIAGDGKPIVAFACRFERSLTALTLAEDVALLNPPQAPAVEGMPADKLAVEVERRGGTVAYEANDPKKPIIAIDFKDAQLNDADLGMLKGQSSLKRLDLKNAIVYFDRAGLNALESLANLEYFNVEHARGRLVRLPQHLQGLKKLKSLGLAHASNGNAAADAPILGTMTSLEELSISDDFTDASMEQLSKLTNLRLLYIDDTPITNIGIKRLRELRKLRTLSVFSAVINDDGYQSLEVLHDLDHLSLGGQELTSAVLDHVKAPNLEYLYLGGAGFDDGVAKYLTAMPKLKSLHLRGNSLSDEGLGELNSLKNLVTLDLEQGHLMGEGLAKLTDLKRLRRLDLAGNPIQGSALAALKNFPALEELDLSHSHVTGESLSNLKDLSNLRELKLQDVRLTDEALANTEPLVKLESVDLQSTGIDGGGLSYLARLPHLYQLQLQQNPITDDNGAPLGEMKNLKSVNLEETKIGDATLAAIGKLAGLQILIADETKITDRGIESLATNAQLRELNVGNPQITDAAIKTISRLHDLRIVGLNSSKIDNRGVTKLENLPHLRALYLHGTHAKRQNVHRLEAKLPNVKIYYNFADQPDFHQR